MAINLENTITDLHQRVSTQEVDEVINQLQAAFIDGRLDEEDFDNRMNVAFSAKNRKELMVVLNDLAHAVKGNTTASAISRSKISSPNIAICSGNEVRGPFIMPKKYRIVAIMGGAVLDLREAYFESAIIDISVTVVMGGVQIFIPKNVVVHMQGLPILGGFSQSYEHVSLPSNAAPFLRIHGVAVMGGVDVSYGDNDWHHQHWHHKRLNKYSKR